MYHKIMFILDILYHIIGFIHKFMQSFKQNWNALIIN